ncbi:MAG: tRNA dihydrouridine synthase DusB [Rickettsiales bacterium]|jgi:tRNA-dihydrouridine synthase B|nr:tRNA dihydrouridine synthase DusB [Rickettsiales bacterium]
MLKPIQIGNIKINSPVIIAPMAGITDLPFCEIYKSHGAELIVMEMIASNAQQHFSDVKHQKKLETAPNKVVKMFDTLPKNLSPISVQIFGSNPDIMAQATKINIARGADIIDINMGCPVGKIVKSGSGADLLKDVRKAEEIVRAVVLAANGRVPITLKIRTGWSNNLMTGVEVAQMAEQAGVSMIAVHGRTRTQMYMGDASLPEIAKIKRAVKKIPVIGNGDILTVEDAKKMIDETGVDGVMIGRGVFGRPIFIEQIINYLNHNVKLPGLTSQEIGKIALAHFEKMLNFYGEKNAIFLFRKFGAYYSKNMFGATEFRTKINQIIDVIKMQLAIKEFFEI